MVFDKLEYAEKYYCLGDRIKQGLEYLQATDFSKLEDGMYDVNENIFAVVSSYNTMEKNRLESHKDYVDIQYEIEGTGEYIAYKHISELKTAPTEIDKVKDILFYDDEETEMGVLVKPGMFAIFMQQDAHNPCLIFKESSPHRKVVVKIKVN